MTRLFGIAAVSLLPSGLGKKGSEKRGSTVLKWSKSGGGCGLVEPPVLLLVSLKSKSHIFMASLFF